MHFRNSTKNISCFVIIIEFFVLTNAWIFSYLLRFRSFFDAPKGVPNYYICLKLLPFLWFSWLAVRLLIKNNSSIKKTTARVDCSLQQLLFFLLGFVCITYFYKEYKYSRLSMLMFMGILPVLFWLVDLALKGFNANKNINKRIAIVTSHKNLKQVLSVVCCKEELKHCYVVVVLLEDKVKLSKDSLSCTVDEIVCCPEVLDDFIVGDSFDAVYVSLSHKIYNNYIKELTKIASHISQFVVVPDLDIYSYLTSSVEITNKHIVVNVNDTPLQGGSVVIKRLIDVIGGGICVVLFLPFFIIISLLIKLTTGGPVIFFQKRMGLDGKEFIIYKFCTMNNSSKKDSYEHWTTVNDSRVNVLGKFLRKTSLDEIPQFFNVIKGEMSLVGPRPERAYFVNQFRKKIPGYMLRHKVKSGLTGWAQINGLRGDTSIEKRIELDLYYIQQWSLWLDIKILFTTIYKGFISPNAY